MSSQRWGCPLEHRGLLEGGPHAHGEARGQRPLHGSAGVRSGHRLPSHAWLRPVFPEAERWTRLLGITGLRNASPGKQRLRRGRRGQEAVTRSDAAGASARRLTEAPEIRAPSDRMRSPPGGVLRAPVQGQWGGQVGLRRLVCT